MRNYLIILFLLFSGCLNGYAQSKSTKGNFNQVIKEEEGDLNYDGRLDKVYVKMDITDATRPLLLQIFLSAPGKGLKLAVSSTQLIEPQYPAQKGGKFNGYQIPDFFIEGGNLVMISEIKDGNITHEFKFQHGNFELIKVSRVTYDGVNTTIESVFNLKTGVKTAVEKLLGSEKIKRKTRKIIKISPLPKLQDFKFTDKEKF
jgi:hypothetical protein